MAPRKRNPPPPSAGPTKAKQPRQSALAKEHHISASTEAEVKEAFSLFASSDHHKELPSSSLRRALTALGVPPSSSSELQDLLDAADPDDEGTIAYPHFVAVAALKLNNRTDESKQEEIAEAFRLFTQMGGDEGKITMSCLRRVAKELNEDVSDDVLKSMVLEANGGSGVGRGVGMRDFEEVMRRAGIFQ